jgi:hypothetical protein
MNYFIGVAQNAHFSRVVHFLLPLGLLTRLQIVAELVALATFIAFDAEADSQLCCMCGSPSPSCAS